MIFGTLRLIIWLAGVAVIGYFVISFLGYQVNWEYFHSRRSDCQAELRRCQDDLIHRGLDGAKATCLERLKCVDPNLLIRKQ